MSHLKSDSPPAVDLIVVLYGSLRHVEGLAEGIEAQTYPQEKVRLFFVDNGPDDGALDALATRFAAWPGGLRLLPLRDNPGFAAGNNRAIVAGESRFLLLLNPDTRMAPDCLERLVARGEAEPHS
ncbi:MAG: glycosyltransferase, partial [Acidobacteriota bacterium]